MGRTPIRARDSVGFVANRCVRPFFLESLRMLGEGVAPHDEIDRIVRLGAGLRMGPFELMDLIGIDVNFAVAKSFWEQSFGEPRWRPTPIHERMVAVRPARPEDRARLLRLREGHAPPTPRSRLPGRAADLRRGPADRGRRARTRPPVLTRLGATDRQRGLLRARRAGGLGGGHQHGDAARIQLADRPARMGRAARLEPLSRGARGAARAAGRGLPAGAGLARLRILSLRQCVRLAAGESLPA